MTTFNINNKLPLFCIFIFFILICADATSSLFPCHVRRILESNLALKHFMLYLTITFLVVLLEDLDKNLTEVFLVSFYLYLIFILISKTEYGFFIAIIILTAVIYVLYLKRNEIAKRKEDTTSNEELEKLEKTKNLIIKINNGISIVVFILAFIGFMIYMGRKKFEYKNNFNYLTFIFGKVECKGTISNIDYSTSLKHIFK